MSQVDLALALATHFGSDPDSERRSLINYEQGANVPRLHRLEAIAQALGKPLDYFAVGDGGDADGIDAVRLREVV